MRQLPTGQFANAVKNSSFITMHPLLTRREFLQLGATAAGAGSLFARGADTAIDVTRDITQLTAHYLTPQLEFNTVERGDPLPYELPLEKRRALGLERESWRLEVVADPQSNSVVDNPLSKERGTAFTWDALLGLAERKAVKYLKAITCNNLVAPLGMGLWEGVPLRDVLWLAKPRENIRHVFYYGYHNDDPKQMFECWLPINRVLEDPPGELPVMLCYKLNGEWLAGKRGGPVRLLVPEAYGFKSVKWLTHVVFTNNHQANDTYAEGNNDTHSWLKTFARFASVPERVKSGEPIVISGAAQVGVSGLAKVEYSLQPKGAPPPKDDPYFTTVHWDEARDSASTRIVGGRARHERTFRGAVRSGHSSPAALADALHHRALDRKIARCGARYLRCAVPHRRSGRAGPTDAAPLRKVGAQRHPDGPTRRRELS